MPHTIVLHCTLLLREGSCPLSVIIERADQQKKLRSVDHETPAVRLHTVPHQLGMCIRAQFHYLCGSVASTPLP